MSLACTLSSMPMTHRFGLFNCFLFALLSFSFPAFQEIDFFQDFYVY
jgi:hypothetical protein